MLRLAKDATPATAATDVVPVSVPPFGLVPIVMVIVLTALGTVFPNPSCTATATGGAIGAPCNTLTGCVTNASVVALPAATLNVALVAAVRAPDVTRSV